MQNRFIYPVDTYSFEDIRKQGKLYVDKTGLINDIVNVRLYKYVFLARPRRFGKSLLCNTLHAYFEGRKELFEGLKIAESEKDWKKYPVLHFDMSVMRNCTSIEDMKEALTQRLAKYETEYGVKDKANEIGTRFSVLIQTASETTEKPVVVIIDEYDTPMLRNLYNKEMKEKVRTFMKAFYQILKVEEEYLKFVFLTGITKFSQMSIFSELNNLNQISMFDEYSGICGITQEELDTILRPGVEDFAEAQDCSVDEAYAMLKKNYDGYHFSKNSKDVYAPFCLLRALSSKEANHYWFESGMPTSLFEHLKHYPAFNLLDYDGVKVGENEFNISCEDSDTPIPLLYQSGYLSIDTYNRRLRTYILHFPNFEVRTGMIECLVPIILKRSTADNNSLVRDMAECIFDGDLSGALTALRAYIAGIPYDIITKTEWDDKASREAFYKLLFYIVFSLLNSTVDTEVKSILGRADVVIQTEDDVFVLELAFDDGQNAVDDTVDTALKQIDDKGYAIKYSADGRKITKCGISISSGKRNIAHWRTVDEKGNIIDEQKF